MIETSLVSLCCSPEYGDRAQALESISRHDFSYTTDYRIVPELIATVQQEVKTGEEYYSKTTPRNLAIRALGKLRAREAVPVLIEMLIPRAGQSVLTMDKLMQYGHAGYALVDIGTPAVGPLVSRIIDEGNSELRVECLKVAVRIVGIEEVHSLIAGKMHGVEHVLRQPDSVLEALNKAALR